MRISKKQFIDQGLHYNFGFFGVLIIMYAGFGAAPAMGTVLGVALAREVIQHGGIKNLGKGSMIDMFFWLLGTGVGAWAY